MANEFLPKESERFASVVEASPIPDELSQNQISYFSQLIKDNPDHYFIAGGE